MNKQRLKHFLMIITFLFISSCLGKNDLIETIVPDEESFNEEHPAKCSNDMAYKCIGDNWKLDRICGKNESCSVSNGVAGCVNILMELSCSEIYVTCFNNKLISCESGGWTEGEDCSQSGSKCMETPDDVFCERSEADLNLECEGQDSICFNNKVYNCGEHGPELSKDCNLQKMKCDINKCVSYIGKECESDFVGVTFCLNNSIVSCKDGFWMSEECEKGTLCNEFMNSALCQTDIDGTPCSGNN